MNVAGNLTMPQGPDKLFSIAVCLYTNENMIDKPWFVLD